MYEIYGIFLFLLPVPGQVMGLSTFSQGVGGHDGPLCLNQVSIAQACYLKVL